MLSFATALLECLHISCVQAPQLPSFYRCTECKSEAAVLRTLRHSWPDMSTEASGSSRDHSSPGLDADSDGSRSAQMPQSSYAAGWDRLSAAFHSATARVEPGQVVRLQITKFLALMPPG